MVRLKIESKKDSNYELIDSNGKVYNINFEFFGIEKEPDKNDYISISAELLNPRYKEYSIYLSFGDMDDTSGREKSKLNDTEILKIETEDKEIYLKRLYG